MHSVRVLPCLAGILLSILSAAPLAPQDVPPLPKSADVAFPVSAAERARIEKALPAKPVVTPAKQRRLLIFDLNVGYPGHRSMAHAEVAFTRMGKKTGAFDTVVSRDPAVFEPQTLRQFDAVYFNNTVGNLFTDPELRQSLMEFVYAGGGILGTHGTTVAFTRWPGAHEDWPEFGRMLAARGASHRDSDEHVVAKFDDPDHPLNRPFGGSFDYRDEFFRVHGPYSRNRVRVLFSMDTKKTDMNQGRARGVLVRDDDDYALAWVRNYGRGRIFYCTIGHNPYVFWDPLMLKFYLGAIQFALGDLPAPTIPSARLTAATRAQEKLGWRLGVTAYSFHKYTAFEAIEKTAELGLSFFGGLSFQKVSKDIPKNFDAGLTDDEIEQVRLKLDSAGVRLVTCYYHDIPGDEAGCRRVFEFGRKLGIETFISEPKLEALDTIEKWCDEYDIQLAIHNHGKKLSPHYWHPEELAKICRGRTKRIGSCADIGYWMRSGIDPIAGVKTLGDRLLAVQLHDLHELGGEGHDVPWGKGVGKTGELLEAIHRLGIRPTMFGLEYSYDWFDSMPEMAESAEFFNGICLKLAGATVETGDAGASVRPVSADELGFDEIVFVKRKPYSSDHYYTDINNGTSPDRFVPENGIYLFNLSTRRERPIVTAAEMPGGKGFIGKCSLSFDAKKVIFDFRETPRAGFRIWEVNVDGTGLRQVSFPPADEEQKSKRWNGNWHTDDIHPAYLPDGKIIFSSTRCEHTVLCGGSAHLVAPVLHRMDADGTNIEQLTQSPVSEFCPVVRDDGRVMYHRWEYIDKGARVCKTIWSMNPDGSGARELYGVADDTTTVYMYPQSIPGRDQLLVCVGTCHFPQGGCLGAIMLIDLKQGSRTRGPDPDEADYGRSAGRYAVTNITPQVFVERRTEPGWHFRRKDGSYVHDREGQSGHLYTHPYPVSETKFLVSYKVDSSDHYKNVADAYSLYLIDTDGNHRPIHADDELSCWHPTPLVARRVPPTVRSHRDPELAARGEALCVVANVYQGMKDVKPGEVKWLRINEAIPRYWDTGRRWRTSLSSSGWKAALWPRVQWGVVPVEEDGSAHFVVPANRNIFFQALDEDFREVQRERTYINYRPGEVRSCGGCHGQAKRTVIPSGAETPLALRREPTRPQPQPCDLIENGGDGRAGQVIHYPTDIQPLFNARCISCHGANEPAGGLRLTGEVTLYYNTSYEELARKQLAGPIISEFTSFLQGDRGNYNGAEFPPKNVGCRKSTLIAVLTDPKHPKNTKEDHSRMLTETELMILSRWVDSNYQFYGTYYGRHHPRWVNADPAVAGYTPKDFRRRPTFEEAIDERAPVWHR